MIFKTRSDSGCFSYNVWYVYLALLTEGKYTRQRELCLMQSASPMYGPIVMGMCL